MIKTYRLKKEYPGHNIGDMLYKPSDDSTYYDWDVEPFTKVPIEIVENHSEFFEEVINNWKMGDKIYFLSVSGEIIDENFDSTRHIPLIYWGNAFRDENEAKWYQIQFAKLIDGEDSIVINKKDILPIFLALQDNDIEKAKSLIKNYL